MALALVAVRLGAQTRQETAPTTPGGKKAENHIYAQQVVNEIMDANPDVLAMGLHSIPPGVDAKVGTKGQVCIASSLDLIGVVDSPGDLAVAAKDQVNIGRSGLGKITRMKVAAAFRDGSGNIIGYCMVSFPSDVDHLTAHTKTKKILDELAQKFPDQASLFKPTS